jgi:hypothetical protein
VSAATALLCAAAVAAFVAATEPRIRAGRAPTLRLLFHDASASCGARETPDEDEIAALIDGLGPGDLVASVSFGAHLGAVVPRCAPSDYRRRLDEETARARSSDPHGSSLFNFLIGEIRPMTHDEGWARQHRRLEIVLATDGLATDATPKSVEIAARLLRDAGCTSVRVLRRESVAFPSVVAELRGPGVARAGEPFSLEARGVAATDDAVVELSDATHVVETRRVATKGAFRLAFTRIEETTGPVTFSARVAGPGDIPPPVARVAVTSPGAALVVGAARRDIPGVAGTWRDAYTLREDDAAATFAAHDVVVLDDLSADLLDKLDAALASFVERGGGLVLLGGAHSFGAGGWAGLWIDRLSPLVSRPHDETGTFLYLALDGSGSMAEPWSDAPGAATRDDVVRGAARSLARFSAADTIVALRRFAGDLLPAGAAAETQTTASLSAAVDRLAPPGGPTALLPPLREALSLASSRSEKRKSALVLTDGRTPERSADLHAALVALDAAHVRVTFVLPGDAALDDEAHTLKEALAGTNAQVRGVTSPERLAEIFREVEEKARVDDPIVTDRRLVADEGAGGIVGAVPESAARVDRVWLADGARQLVLTDHAEPVAALRRVGLGTVAALATRPGDAEWLAAGERTEQLVASLVRAAARPASGRWRVERDGDTRILVRCEPPPGGAAPGFVELDDGTEHPTRAPLMPAAGGLLVAEWPLQSPHHLDGVARDAPHWISFVAADGRVLATAGLDTPAPAEYRDPPSVDLDALAALVSSDDQPASAPLAPWFAALAVALALASVLAARVKSRMGLAR